MLIKPKDTVQAGGVSFVSVKDTKSNHVLDRVCFGYVPNMTSQEYPIVTMSFPDITEQMMGTDKYTEAYFGDIDEYLGKYFIRSQSMASAQTLGSLRYRGANNFMMKAAESTNFHVMEADTSKVSGSLFLGIMNLYKQVGEQPSVPVAYSILKKEYKELRFYQRLVAAHLLCPKTLMDFRKAHSGGQHVTFRSSFIKHIADLKLSSILSGWRQQGFFLKENSLAYCHEFAKGSGDSSMNYRMLPGPWSSVTLPAGVYMPPRMMELNMDNVEYLLDSRDTKPRRGKEL